MKIIPKMLNAPIKSMKMLNENICQMVFESEYVANNALAGQFVNLRCGDGLAPLLRRPVSICDINHESNEIRIVFALKSTGTKLLAKLNEGDKVDVLGPLGKGFYIEGDKMGVLTDNILVIGGGIGVFPLLYLLKKSTATRKAAILGFRNSGLIVLEDEFKRETEDMKIFTDDGSYGHKGVVVNGLKEYIEENKVQMVYACGPGAMLKGVVKAVVETKADCQVSVEQRMGCGIGACLVCACKAKAINEGEEFVYKHVCKDGPVFWAEELIFE